MNKHTDLITTVLNIIVAATLVLSLGIGLLAPVYFSTTFAAEDRLVEYATAFGLLLASGILAAHGVRLLTTGYHLRAALLLFYAVVFFFASGEEVSWGQRILGFESNEFFVENNHQKEFNLHNLRVGEKQLTKSLFGPILTLIMFLYLVVLPLVYNRWNWARQFSRALMVPVPHLVHATLIFAASVLMLIIDIERNWEVYEYAFALITASIFLKPKNQADFYPSETSAS